MAKERNNKEVKTHLDMVKIYDKFFNDFKEKHGIELSYTEVSKKIADKIEEGYENLNKDGSKLITPKIKNNLYFIDEEIETPIRMDAEHYATGYFKELGYKVYFTKDIYSSMKKGTNSKKFETLCLYDNYVGIRQCIEDVLGRPDLIILSKTKAIFVEVKTNGDNLSEVQMDWIMKHNNMETILFNLKQIIQNGDKR